MTLIVDQKSDLGSPAGLHAFIAGVSLYEYLPRDDEPPTSQSHGLRQLASPALAAYKIYRWLVDHQNDLPVQLATCRLLLSPSEVEKDLESSLRELTEPCTIRNFLTEAKGWRDDASSFQGNMTLFYFAGHGAQRTRDDSVLLMEDFNEYPDGPLTNAVALDNIFKGMATSDEYPDMAQTQLYFVDACRDFLEALRNFEQDTTTQVFRVRLSGQDRRHAPIFFAAFSGGKATGMRGDQTIFSKALLECLTNDAGRLKEVNGEEKWYVSVHSLNEALRQKFNELNSELGADQDYILSGLVADRIINFLQRVPSVEVVLEVNPPKALPFTKIEVLDDRGAQVPGVPVPLHPHPYRSKWTAGFYTINAEIDPPQPHFASRQGTARAVMPPSYRKKVTVTR